MQKPADTDHPIHPLLERRWSPRAFSDKPVDDQKLRSLFEAARWAPSSMNEQPWRFLVATKADPDAFGCLLDIILEGNRAWAKDAPVLVVTAVKEHFEYKGRPNRTAHHDLGLAVGNLTVEATAQGLAVHQMGGIDLEKARDELGIPEGYSPVTAIAIGYPGEPEDLPTEKLQERERASRERLPQEDVVFGAWWGEAAVLSDG